MQKNFLLIIVLIAVVLGIFFLAGAQQPGSGITAQPDPVKQVPMYPAGNLSTTVHTPKGTMIVNATVPESFTIMPVYRLNISQRRTVTIDRIPVFREISDSMEDHKSTAPVIIADTGSVKTAGEKILQEYQLLPDDIVIWRALKFEHSWGGDTPSELYSNKVPVPYTRIIYTRMINGQPVDNWGINHEKFGAGEYGNLETDHDFVVIGISEDAEPIFITERWTPSEFVSSEPVISAQEALGRLKRWEYSQEDYGSIKDLQVQTIRQGYFEATGYTSIIEPAWFFSGMNQDGYDQTVVVLARANDSAVLPFYNWSNRDSAVPGRFPDYSGYKNWNAEHSVNGTGLSMESAIDIVKAFSGNPNLVIENTTEVKENRGCGSFATIYNITTNEGVYTIDPGFSVVRSVSYPVNRMHARQNPVEYPEVMEISADYVQKKFGIDPIGDPEQNPYITEYPNTFLVNIPLNDFTIYLLIDKQTGDVVSYLNANTNPQICIKW